MKFNIELEVKPGEIWIRKSTFEEVEVVEITNICIEISANGKEQFKTPESFFCDYRRKE